MYDAKCMYTIVIYSTAPLLYLHHQRNRLTAIRLTARNSELHVIFLQYRGAIHRIINKEDLVQLSLESAHERPKISFLSINSQHHRLTLNLHLGKRDQIGALGQLSYAARRRRDAPEEARTSGVVVQEAV